jgi:hypothetical protein
VPARRVIGRRSPDHGTKDGGGVSVDKRDCGEAVAVVK